MKDEITLREAVARYSSELGPLKHLSASFNYYRMMAKDNGLVIFRDVSESGNDVRCNAWKSRNTWVLEKTIFEKQFDKLCAVMKEYNPPRPIRWWKGW